MKSSDALLFYAVGGTAEILISLACEAMGWPRSASVLAFVVTVVIGAEIWWNKR